MKIISITKFKKGDYIITCTGCVKLNDSYEVCLNEELKFYLYVFRADVIDSKHGK